MFNPITLIDGYKLDHRRQYPKGTRFVYSNFTPRKSRVNGQEEVVFFGLQYFIMKYLEEEMQRFFGESKKKVSRDFMNRVNNYLGPNSIGVEHIEALHNLQYIPLEIRAFREGCLVPVGTPMLTIENTDPDFFWLVNYFETILSCVLWGPCTSATTAYRYRKFLDAQAELTGADLSFVQWQGHDFSFRGMMGLEAAALSGAGHLLSFAGTDTIPALDFIDRYYSPEGKSFLAGSVAATEHSVMSAGGELSELETYNRLLDLYPTGIVSVVSDTWDLWNVIENILPQLKDKILARDGKLVIRPDSGDPVKIICGDPNASRPAARKGVIRLLWELFGGARTSENYKVLNPHIGVIYGDSITYDRCEAICNGLKANGFASTNMVFGIGSYTYQYVTRDTFGFAMKATWAQVGDESRDLFKRPVTDSGEKFSAKGRLAVLYRNGQFKLIQQATKEEELSSLLQPVWKNGNFRRYQNINSMRKLLHPNWEI